MSVSVLVAAIVAMMQLLLHDAVALVPPQQRQAHDRQARQGPQCAAFEGINMCQYDNHASLVSRLRDLEARYPGLARVGSVGQSSQGRDMAFIELSANVSGGRGLGEPMFKLVGNMHGDETVGRQMVLYLAQYLLQGYGSDPRVTRILDTTTLLLLPTMNPDGFERSAEGCGLLQGLFRTASGRENANGVDLNRDFPKQFDEPQNVPFDVLARGRQPETVNMMRWIVNNPFVLSANLHAGAVVASYPFDDSPQHGRNVYSPSPDDDVFRFVANLYASNHAFMWKGDSCGDRFPGGITNGAQWYDVPGGMQDFNYVHSNDFEITLELSCCKHPDAGTLTQEWQNNKESMLKYIEATHLGIKGMVRDPQGQPVPNARVVVQGISKAVRSTDRGEYWRLLAPNTYVVFAQADGFQQSEPETVTISSDWPPKAVVKNFQLKPL